MTAQPTHILTMNGGSSSIKFTVYTPHIPTK